jgi:O-methyltransferase involved in polyketide biosynthesis
LKEYSNVQKQMINLGAGFDSTYFRLKTHLDKTLYIEIDFPDVINRKINLIKSNEILFDQCPDLCLINNTNGNFG